MKIVVIGGTGLIGSKVVRHLRDAGHDVVAGSPSTGINTLTGEGLAAAMAGAQVVVNLANSPSFEDKAVLAFFQTSGRNLLAAETEAGVRHHVALSVVGTDLLPDSGYLRAKLAQETLIRASGIPFTIVRATQFFEFMGAIAAAATTDQTVRLSTASFQPIAASDVASLVAEYAIGAPVNGIVDIAGPERASMANIVQRFLTASGDTRRVIADPQAGYFGARLSEGSLVPAGANPRLGATTFDRWYAASLQSAAQ